MRWRQGRRSRHIEDRRGRRGAPVGAGIGGLGILLILVFAFITGQNPLELLRVVEGPPTVQVEDPGAVPGSSGPDPQADFVAAVLASTEDTWSEIFAAAGGRYVPPTLVLFEDAVQSACGLSAAAVGPFYCPPDQRIYIDLTFFRDLDQRFGAPGDFAQAYVIAHEVGHHLQNQLGVDEQVRAMRQRVDEVEANVLSVKQELQADCLAGVWGHHANRRSQLLEPGDVEEGLSAAAAIGDDRLQQRSQGYVHPESWTHGSSAQRVEWLRRGLETGDLEACDTF